MIKTDNQYVFKIIIAGDSGVGKTSLVRRYIDNEFIPTKKATIGIDYFLKNIKIRYPHFDSIIALQIWDLAGEEKYKTFLPAYLPGTNGIIFVFSPDIEESLNYLENFVKDLQNLLKQRIPMILIKAKKDLTELIEESEFARKFMTENKISFYLDTSAKTGENVEKAFTHITELILKENGFL